MFTGYTQETFEFFMALRFNNNRAFFHANYDWYTRAVRQPSIDLASDLCETIEDIDPELERRPYRVISHINRDIRFSNDKTPYRDYVWLNFKHADATKGKLPELYFEINDENAAFGMGFYRPNATAMKRFRARVDADPSAAERQLIPRIQEYAFTEFPDRKIIIPDTVPEGLRTIYGANRFYLTKDIKDFDLLKSPQFATYLKEKFTELKVLYKYICDPYQS